MSSMRRLALMFSATTASVFTHLGEYAFRQVIIYEVSRTVHEGVGYIRGRVVPMLSYSGTGDYDDKKFLRLPGPTEDEVPGEKVLHSAATNPCRLKFAALDPSSTTSATLGKGCRAAMARKSGRPGVYIGKALPPTAMGRGGSGATRRPTRAASPSKTVATVGGSHDGTIDLPGDNELAQMTSFPPEDGDGQVSTALVPFVASTALVPFVASTALVPFVASTALVPFAFTTALVPFVPLDGQFCRAAVGETAEGCGEAMAAAHSNPLPNEPILTDTVHWWQPGFTTVADALAPWVFAAGRGLIAWAWLTRFPHIGSALRMRCWMLLCLVTTSSQALDGLFTVDTWGATLSLGKLVASQTWLATLFLSNTWLRVLLLAKLTAAKTWLAVKLAGSVGLAVVCSDFASVVLVLLAGATFIWIVAIYDAQLEAEKMDTSPPPSPAQSISPATPATPAPAPAPEAPKASPAPPTPSQTMHGAVAAVPTAAERKARRKARLRKRRERGIDVHVSAMRC